MKKLHKILFVLILIAYAHASWSQTQKDTFKSYFATVAPIIDGKSDDACWTNATWYQMDNIWLGGSLSETDFSGKYKLAWDKDYLYVIVEIVDDVLFDNHPNLFGDYWTGDCIELFLDEDRSKGYHQNNYNAFAYHCGPRGTIVDLGTDGPLLLNNNVLLKVDTVDIDEGIYNWEFAIKIFDYSFDPSSPDDSRIELETEKVMGLSLAYCDNDGFGRDHFIGSMTPINGNNDGNWITADYFGSLLLMEEEIPTSIHSPSEFSVTLYPIPSSDYFTIEVSS
jgi:hypothetical protein